MKKPRKTKRLIEKARRLLRTIPRVSGEERTIYACGDCGKLFGRRYIPHGIGHGLTVGACLCQLTAHRPMHAIYSTRR